MRAATGVPSVGTLWSAVASVRSGRRTGRPARRRPSKAWGLVTSWTRWRSMKMRPAATSWADQILSNRVVGVMRSFLGLAASKAGGDDREQRRLLRAGVLEEVREIRVEGDDVARAERDGLGVAVQDNLALLDERGLARAGFVHRRVPRTAGARAGVQHVPGQLRALAGQGRRQDLVAVPIGAAGTPLPRPDDGEHGTLVEAQELGEPELEAAGDALGDLERRTRLATLDLREHRRGDARPDCELAEREPGGFAQRADPGADGDGHAAYVIAYVCIRRVRVM